MKQLIDKSIKELAVGLRNGDFSSVDLVSESIARINEIKTKTNSFISTVSNELVLNSAKEKDKNIKNVDNPLYGLPFTMKDIYQAKGTRTTSGSNPWGIKTG